MSKSALGRPGRTQVAKKEENGAFWGAFFDRFFDIFASAHNARKRNTYITLGGFWHPKTSLCWIHFRSLLGPFPDTPLEGFFEPSWHARVPTYTHKVNFGPLLGSPWAPKSTLGASRIGQEAPKREVPRMAGRVFLCLGAALDASSAPKSSWVSYVLILDIF